MKVHYGFGFSTCLNQRLPIGIEDRWIAVSVRLFRQGNRGEAARRIAANLGGTFFRVGEVGDPQRDNPLGVGAVPFLEKPIVPGLNAGEAESRVFGFREQGAPESGDAGREVDRGVNASDIHIVNPCVNIPATPANFIEARRFDPVILARAPGDSHEAHLKIRLVLDHPDFMAFGGFDHARGGLAEFFRKSSFEGILRFHEVIVNRNEGVMNRTRLRVGRERFTHRSFDTELYGLNHGAIPCPRRYAVQAPG